MSEAACKAAICDDKAQSTANTLFEVLEILKNESPALRIEVAEFVIGRNERTLEKVLEMVGDA